jgi:hypothetical protein
MIEIITPEEYVWPVDGYDYCGSCDYLLSVHTTYGLDDGSRVVPLCFGCAENMGVA